MNAKHFAWFYLIENGYAGSRFEYYGGTRIVDERLKIAFGNGYVERTKANEFYLNEIRTIGVDWERSSAPDNGSYSTFNGTFADSSSSECIEGTLYLLNGLKQNWIAESVRISNVFQLMADTSAFQERMTELFGDI
jgi:hypothetical protein